MPHKDPIQAKIQRHNHYLEHQEYYIQKAHKWYRKNKKQYNTKKKIYKAKHNEEYARYAKSHQRYYLESLFIYALDIICNNTSHKCKKCAQQDLRCLHFDHINGSGTKERAIGYAPYYLYIWIINHIKQARKKYQVLCVNCNMRKRWINKEWLKYK